MLGNTHTHTLHKGLESGMTLVCSRSKVETSVLVVEIEGLGRTCASGFPGEGEDARA